MLGFELIDDDYCQGVQFVVSDMDALSEALALVLIQEYALAKALVSGTPVPEDEVPKFEEDEIEDIISRRLKPKEDTHRDGFLFQLMMWLAAYLDLVDGDLVALPHSQASAKGQDSIVVHRKEDAVVAISICEDKATTNPRDTVRDDVWPEIKTYEEGGRWDELRSNIIATLGTGGVPTEEAIRLIRGISWEGRRRYRVRVTIEQTRSQRLFRGFDEIVGGDRQQRRGETVEIPGMRQWMSDISAKVEAKLRTAIREPPDV